MKIETNFNIPEYLKDQDDEDSFVASHKKFIKDNHMENALNSECKFKQNKVRLHNFANIN